MNSIFIIGQHRTGSTLLKNILDQHSDITMAFDEMNVFEPFRKNTIDKILESENVTSHELTGRISNKEVYGTFWREFEQSGIQLDELEQYLKGETRLSPASVMKATLELLKKRNSTEIVGVKYPLHFRKVDYLREQFPESVILFLTRNPKAIISSKLHDDATKQRKEKSVVYRMLVHYFTLIYFSIEYILSVKMYMKNRDRLMLVTYENLVTNMRETVRQICIPCNIQLEEKMLQASGKSSSYKIDSTKGIHAESIRKYKDTLSGFDLRFIDILTNRYYKKIKHESGSDI